MSERDTLAALLHEPCVEAQMGAPMSPGLAAIDADWHGAEADRLIAAGVRLAPAPSDAPRFDHDGTYRHHHDDQSGEPIWWLNAEQFGGEKRHHVHWHRALAPADTGLREAARAYLDAFDMPLTTDAEVHYDMLTAAREALRAALDAEAGR